MTYDTLIREFLTELPEFKAAYETEVDWWDGKDPGPHNFFGDVVTPYLINSFKRLENLDVVTRIFKFLEDMATCEDTKTLEVLAYTVLERIGDDKDLLREMDPFMSNNIKKLSGEVEQFWGRR